MVDYDLTMKLRKLFKVVPSVKFKSAKDPEITGISSNSKLVAPGNLFIAKKGFSDDGNHYIREATRAGASAILTDLFDPSLKEVIQVIHPNPKAIEGDLAANFYHNPSDALFMVGITGTNGKTTTSFLVKYLLDHLNGAETGLIGTIEYIVGQQRYQAIRTTPDVLTNQKMLKEMCHQGCKSAVMEVTSHALDQGRVNNLRFDVAIFTNLSLDHLDYHKTMDAYAAAKNRLFSELNPSYAVANADSPWLEKILNGYKGKIVTYGIENASDLRALKLKLTSQGTTFTLLHQGKSFNVEIPLVGRFNVYNCLAAIGACLPLQPIEKIISLLTQAPSVPGRLEPVPNPLNLKIYVDFAHTDDALQNVLVSLSEFKTGKLITVFGCGGDRDRSKRALMAMSAEKYSDHCIITSDNPRTENPEEICKEIATGFKNRCYEIELDRKKAIAKAIEMASPNDIILIAGKGHETSQVFAYKTIEFNDRKVAEELCKTKFYAS